jgi:hypothetical protein
MRIKSIPLAVMACVLLAPFAHAGTVEFPGPIHRAPSPDGKADILNTDRDKEPNHVLSIQDRDKHTIRQLFPYDRHVEVSWSPDSKFFFVNDYFGSDVSRCLIVDRAHLRKHDTLAALQKDMDKITAHFIGSMRFVTCSSWRKGDKVKVSISVSGDGTDREIRKWFLFDADSGNFRAAH